MARMESSAVMSSLVEASAAISTAYNPVLVKEFPKRVLAESTEERFWRSFNVKSDVSAAFRGRLASIDFCPRSPHTVAVTGAGRVSLFHPRSHEKIKEWHGMDMVYCTRWRHDGNMLATSGEKPTIRLWTLGSMKVFRDLKADADGRTGHRRAVHTLGFLANKGQLVSGGDDCLIYVWDVSTQRAETRIDAHDDYVRAMTPHPHNASLFATGSHDKTVKLWDLRASNAKPYHCIELVDPCTHLAFHPTGGFIAAASGTDVTIWDITTTSSATDPTSTPTCLLSNHTKDITSLAFNNHGSRLLTGSVDRHVKVYETEAYTTVHSMSFPEPVFSVAVSQDNLCYAVGTSEGKLHLRARKPGNFEAAELKQAKQAADAEEAHQEVQLYTGLGNLSVERKKNWAMPNYKAKEADGEFVTVDAQHQKRLKRFDVAFRKFNYAKALDEVLAEKKTNLARHALFYTVVLELQARNGLRIALGGRDSQEVLKIFVYLRESMTASPTPPVPALNICSITPVIPSRGRELQPAVHHQNNTQ
eukprot:TRINITY_DN1236_c0_g1_i2.p1 TRINITY_DN1236_c0_g1~~TRINITY_DN1236_c0_g1_i2.p1  ORF type:complete len:531 (+),score=66.73 TRINITY_DN1236_c0_g1_i2:75-1667(+)